MVRYLILGGGYIGSYLAKHLENAELCTYRIKDENDVLRVLDSHEYDVVINCIGITGKPNIDWCESNKLETFEGNVMIPYLLATELEHNKKLINLGTGCIFSSTEPLDDDATPNFFGSYYSRTKLMAEEIISELANTTTIRIRLPMSDDDSPKNLLTKARTYKKITDIPNSATFMTDIARAIPFIVENEMYGNINLVHPQVVSIKMLADKMGRTDYEEATQDELQVGNRANTVLNPKRLLDAGFKFSDFDTELNRCLKND